MAQIQVTTLLMPVSQICRQCPTPTLVQAYIDATRRFCSRTRWLTANQSDELLDGTKAYVIGDDGYSEVIGIKAMELTEADGRIVALTERDSSKWDKNEDDAQPEFYAYVPESNFSVHPTPNADYEITVNLVLQPKRRATSVDEMLIHQWDEALRAGALAYLLGLPGMAWTDKREAERKERFFISEMNSATSSVARSYNAGVHNPNAPIPRDARPRSGKTVL